MHREDPLFKAAHTAFLASEHAAPLRQLLETELGLDPETKDRLAKGLATLQEQTAMTALTAIFGELEQNE